MWNLYKLFVVVMVLVASVPPAAVAEDDSHPAKIYVVDMQRIINESIPGKAAKNNVESEARKAQTKIDALKAELDRLKEDTGKQASLLSASALEERQDSIIKRQKELQRAIEDQRTDLTKKNDVAIGKVVNEIQQIVKEFSESGEYPVIMEKDPRVVLYASEKIDVTDAVIKKVNEKQL